MPAASLVTTNTTCWAADIEIHLEFRHTHLHTHMPATHTHARALPRDVCQLGALNKGKATLAQDEVQGCSAEVAGVARRDGWSTAGTTFGKCEA